MRNGEKGKNRVLGRTVLFLQLNTLLMKVYACSQRYLTVIRGAYITSSPVELVIYQYQYTFKENRKFISNTINFKFLVAPMILYFLRFMRVYVCLMLTACA